MSEPRSIGVALELVQIERTLDAAALLLEALSSKQLASEDHERRAPLAAAAVVNLARGRLRLITRVIRGRADPALLLTPENAQVGRASSDDPDLLVPVPQGRPARPRKSS